MTDPSQEDSASTPHWVNSPKLTKDPDDVMALDQLAFLNAMKAWAKKYLRRTLTNDDIGALCLVDRPRKSAEAWRARPGSAMHRGMPLQYRMLLIYRLLDLGIPGRVGRFTRSEQDHILTEYKNGTSISEIARQTGRTNIAIRAALRRADVPMRGRTDQYTPQQDDFILENISSLGAAAIATKLGRTPGAIATRAHLLRKSRSRQEPQ